MSAFPLARAHFEQIYGPGMDTPAGRPIRECDAPLVDLALPDGLTVRWADTERPYPLLYGPSGIECAGYVRWALARRGIKVAS